MPGGINIKVAFIDRDGTLNKDYKDKEWSNISWPEILPGTIEGLRYLKEKGYNFIIITNQYIIEEGYITYSSFEIFNKRLITTLAKNEIDILDTFFCPHRRDIHCDCHKPSPGLILQALNKYKEIDLNDSILIGNSSEDLELAMKFNLPFYGINVPCKNSLINLGEIRKFLRN